MRKVKKITTIDDIQARLDKIEQLESESTSASNNRNYELESKFAAYRHARAKKRNAHGDFTYEDVYDTIIQEELDWNLKQQLKVSPEERYQDRKKAWYYHESCYYKRNNGKGGYDGYGCNNGKCIPECRYYPEIGRIEDSEVIAEHEKFVQGYRDKNAIVEPPVLPLQPIPGHSDTCSECHG